MKKNLYENIQINNIIIEPIEVDEDGYEYWSNFYLYLKNKNNSKILICGATAILDYDENSLEFQWEPDGEPTYVPYGNASVLYDSGEGSLESVDTSQALDFKEINLYSINDTNNPDEWEEEPLGQDDIILMLEDMGISIDEFEDVIKVIKERTIEMADKSIQDYYDDPDNWPEKPEDDGPDYDPYDYYHDNI